MSHRGAWFWSWVWMGVAGVGTVLDRSDVVIIGAIAISSVFLALGYILKALGE